MTSGIYIGEGYRYIKTRVDSIAMDYNEGTELGNQNEETRKIQFTGGSSYIVSLPKKWIQDLKLKQGDLVVIARQGHSILQIAPISKRISKEQKEATIEVTKDNSPYFLARKLNFSILSRF